MGKFVISKDSAGDWRFVLKAPNGEVILRCVTGYSCKRNATRAIKSVRRWIQTKNFKLKKTGYLWNKKYFFTYCAPNGKAIGISETYSAKQGRAIGIASVQTHAPQAEIVFE